VQVRRMLPRCRSGPPDRSRIVTIDQARTAAGSASISLAEYHAIQAAIMTEDQLQKVILAASKRYGWLVYHTHDSRRSQPGYPDLHLVHEGHGLSLFRELKTQKGTLRPDQKTWIRALEQVGQNVAVWRPIDWYNDTISGQLLPDTATR
jgi:hypothetical protein